MITTVFFFFLDFHCDHDRCFFCFLCCSNLIVIAFCKSDIDYLIKNFPVFLVLVSEASLCVAWFLVFEVDLPCLC